MEKSTEVFPLEKVPDLVLLCIVNHLPDEDARHLSLTCQRFRKILPNYPHIINGPDVNESGPYDGHFVPTKYFQCPILEFQSSELSYYGLIWAQPPRPKRHATYATVHCGNRHPGGFFYPTSYSITSLHCRRGVIKSGNGSGTLHAIANHFN